MKNVTMKDIAEKLGISVVSVSNALSYKNGVSEEIRRKVMETAEELGYRYNSAERESRDIGTRSVGVLIPERFLGTYEAFYWHIYNKLFKKLSQYGYFGILEILTAEAERKLIPPSILNTNAAKGIIVLGQMNQRYVELLDKSEKPMILLDFYNDRSCYDTITTDNFYNSYRITNYLIEYGHRNIGFVGNIHATSSILDRYLGCCKSLIEHSIPIRRDWLIPDRDEEGRPVELELPEEMPTAFVCNCDETAYKMIERLKAAGLCVPADVSVVGFDNHIYSKISNPQITTIKVDSEAMTAVCAGSIIKKIENPGYRAGRSVIMGDMVIRDSVAKIDDSRAGVKRNKEKTERENSIQEVLR